MVISAAREVSRECPSKLVFYKRLFFELQIITGGIWPEVDQILFSPSNFQISSYTKVNSAKDIHKDISVTAPSR